MFKKIQPDKWRHFYVGILMGFVLQFISWRIFIHHAALSIAIAFAVVIAISYGFELFSKITGMGRYDIMDAVASIIGGVIGMALVLPFQL
ncbi:MAG: hypothetical protein QM802_15720 [Agriterribacter sp.]